MVPARLWSQTLGGVYLDWLLVYELLDDLPLSRPSLVISLGRWAR